MSVVCKSWNSVVMQREIRGAPQLPWLVLPQALNSECLSFSSLSEGKVVELKLPKHARGGQFLASSKGWLVMAKETGLKSEMFLLNPISGVQHQLPSFTTVPSFKARKQHGADLMFCSTIVLSSTDISECMVAAVFNSCKELGLCALGNKSWSVFQASDEDEDETRDILFSCGMLYTLVDRPNSNINGVVATRTLSFGDHQDGAVELKLVYDNYDVFGDRVYKPYDDYVVHLKSWRQSYLVESTSKQVLLVSSIHDQCSNNQEPEAEGGEDKEQVFIYGRTNVIRVYKIDPGNGSILRVQSLKDQTLFLADDGSSLSLPASDFKGLQGNCIYFATSGIIKLLLFKHRRPFVSREIGIFYFDHFQVLRLLALQHGFS